LSIALPMRSLAAAKASITPNVAAVQAMPAGEWLGWAEISSV
jgi:hypothetical protein